MMIQMHNERSNAIGLDWDLSWFGGSWSGKIRRKWNKWQKKA